MGLKKNEAVLSFGLRQTWLGMRAAIGAELAAFGLTVPQFATLMIVDEIPGKSVAEIARAVGSTRQSANEMVAGLERDGLVTRTPHPTDRRTHALNLTELGHERLESALPAVARREEELQAGCTEAQKQAVREWMDVVGGACAYGIGER